MQPTLEVSTHAASLGNNGEVIGLRVVATDEKGKVGTGSVTLKAAAGLLGETELTLDSYGTATTVFSCDVSLDIDCSGSVEITAKWTTAQGVWGDVLHLNAQIHPKCPDPLNILPDTLSHGVICY